MGPPLESIHLDGSRREDEFFQGFGEAGFDLGEFGAGHVDGLVVGSWTQGLEKGAGLGHVGDCMGHGGEDIGMG